MEAVSKRLFREGSASRSKLIEFVLRPGPAEEQELVRHIFREFVVERKCESKIARELNSGGVKNQYGRRWTSWAVRYLLRNENYIGQHVYNRMTSRLGQKPRHNPPDLWVRSQAGFEPIVEPELFSQAQKIIVRRRLLLSHDEMLERLKVLLEEKGELSRTIIDRAYDLPCHTVYCNHFGSLREAYARIGYFPPTLKHEDGRRAAAATMVEVRDEFVNELETAGCAVSYEETTKGLAINGLLSLSIFVARAHFQRDRFPRWCIGRPVDRRLDLAIVVRMDEANEAILEYYLLPPAKLRGATLLLGERNPANVTDYRLDTFEEVIEGVLHHVKAKSRHNRKPKVRK